MSKVEFSKLSALYKITIMFAEDPETYKEIIEKSGVETALSIMELDAIDRINYNCIVEGF